jgi:hypothetical protein
MFNNNPKRIRRGFIAGAIAALLLALPAGLFAQSSPLTVQPSTGRVGVGTTNPNAKIEVKGADVGISVMNNAGNMNYYFGIKDADNNKLYIGAGKDPSQGVAPAIVVDGVAGANRVGVGTMSPWVKFHVMSPAMTLGDSSTWPMWISSGSNGDRLMFASNGTGASQFGIIASASGSTWTNTAINPNGGNVGIATTAPAYTLHVNGTAGKPGGGSWSNSSDIRLKKNVEDLKGVLGKLLKLRPVSFEYKNAEAINELPGTQVGMIAQEVEQVFPQWVDEGADGYKRLTFRGFEGLMVEALRELHNENGELRDLAKQQQSQINEMKIQIEGLQGKIRVVQATEK